MIKTIKVTFNIEDHTVESIQCLSQNKFYAYFVPLMRCALSTLFDVSFIFQCKVQSLEEMLIIIRQKKRLPVSTFTRKFTIIIVKFIIRIHNEQFYMFKDQQLNCHMEIPAYLYTIFIMHGPLPKNSNFFKNDIATQKIMQNINDKILRLGQPKIYSFL